MVALALLDGELTVDSFSEQRRAHPHLCPLMAKVRIVEDPQLTREHAGNAALTVSPRDRPARGPAEHQELAVA